jgi:hypothetical protein
MTRSMIENIHYRNCITFTYDHRTLKIELPVRSAVLKQCTGGLVVRWVTTGEYPLLYVFVFLPFFAGWSSLNVMIPDCCFTEWLCCFWTCRGTRVLISEPRDAAASPC